MCHCLNGNAQKRYTNPERAQELRASYQNNEVVATSSSSIYRFEIKNKQLSIIQSDKIDLIALESNVKYYKNVYYNDNVELITGGAKYTSGRGFLTCNKVTGNYEVDGIFYSDAKIAHYSFDMLYEASEVTFRSSKKYNDPKYLTKAFFQDREPILKRDISFVIPKSVSVDLVEMNFDGYDITKTVEEEKEHYIYRFKCEKLKELKEEEDSPGILHYAPHIVVVTKSYIEEGITQKVIADVNDLYHWYYSLVSEVDIDNAPYSDLVNRLVEDASDEEDKIRRIYYWVQENIKYIAFEDGLAGFKPEAPQQVFTKRYGDCKGMAILTKSMLQLAGIDARLTWIGTDKIPYNYDLPSLSVDNHMICTVFLNDQMYILDATEKYIALGKHAERIQGKEMLIENGNTYIRKTVPVQAAEDNLLLRSEILSIEGEKLIGEGKLIVKGETQKSILYASNNSKVDDQAALFDALSVSDYGNEDLVKVGDIPVSDRDKALELDYSYEIGNRVSQFDDELFIDIDWDKRMSGAEIEKGRRSPFYFGRKLLMETKKVLNIPEGFKVEYLPEKVSFQNGNISVDVSYSKSSNTIVYTNNIKVNDGRITLAEINEWNTIVEALITFYDDQIILKKL